jgi:short chain dehydrogenase
VATFAGGRALVARAVDEFGTVDALALLAGRIPLSPLSDVEDEWDGVITSHLKGHFSLIQAAAPIMKEKAYGRIVGFASVQGTIGDSHQTPYCAAKAGIIGLMRAVTIELDPFGVCANTMCPAGVEGVHGPIADRLVGPSANVAPLVAYLASEQAAWINRHVFDISGSGRLGLYRPMVPERLIERPGGFTLDEMATRWYGCSSRCTPASPASARACSRPRVSNSNDCPRGYTRCCTNAFHRRAFPGTGYAATHSVALRMH